MNGAIKKLLKFWPDSLSLSLMIHRGCDFTVEIFEGQIRHIIGLCLKSGGLNPIAIRAYPNSIWYVGPSQFGLKIRNWGKARFGVGPKLSIFGPDEVGLGQ